MLLVILLISLVTIISNLLTDIKSQHNSNYELW